MDFSLYLASFWLRNQIMCNFDKIYCKTRKLDKNQIATFSVSILHKNKFMNLQTLEMRGVFLTNCHIMEISITNFFSHSFYILLTVEV